MIKSVSVAPAERGGGNRSTFCRIDEEERTICLTSTFPAGSMVCRCDKRKSRIEGHLDLVSLLQSIDSGPGLLHAPALLATIGTRLNTIWYRPHHTTFAHVESTHGFLISGELISIEDATASYKTRVTILVKPLLTELSTATNTLGSSSRLLNRLNLLLLPSLVVGGGSEAKRFPDRRDLGGAKVCLSNKRKVDSKSRKAHQWTNLRGLLGSTVHLETKTVLVETLLESNLRNGLIALPDFFKPVLSSLHKTEICMTIW
mmetsp:Transcript_14651/g.42965  ORF Transcript_14651/g.42965 Transcript_14651/m.42965 type:complete len:259 (-) Transcript_14651:587-1363(-)